MRVNAAYAAYAAKCLQILSQPLPVPFYGLALTVLIWKMAPGSSVDSPCTVALSPMLAKAPLITPLGNQRNG